MLVYIIFCLSFVPYSYIFLLAEGKRIVSYYLAGEFMFKKDQIVIIVLETLITFTLAFTLSMVLIEESGKGFEEIS